VDTAHKLLLSAVGKMKGKALKPARDEFLALGDAKQRALLNASHVIGQSPTITDVVARIRKVIGFPVQMAKLPAFIARLEGWWFNEVIERLTGRNKNPISGVALGLAMDDLRVSFAADSLPIDFRMARPPATQESDDRIFVKQLLLIQLDDKNINHARVDFFRAFAQRSRWLRDDLLSRTQLEDYDTLLMDEWQRERDWIEKEAKDRDGDSEIVKRGVALYRALQTGCRSIRPNCTEPYVGRGSYQVLADRKAVGWHRDFLARLAAGSNGAGSRKEDSSDGME
jgi:hypothetical protein